MKKGKKYSRKVVETKTYTLNAEMQNQINEAIKALENSKDEDVQVIKENYKSNIAMITVDLRNKVNQINSRSSELESIAAEIDEINEKIVSRQQELSENGKRNYVLEKNDSILRRSQDALRQYEKDYARKSVELEKFVEQVNVMKIGRTSEEEKLMKKQVENAEFDFKKSALLLKREMTIKNYYSMYKDAVSKLDDTVKTERETVEDINAQLKQIESDFESYKKQVEEKYKKKFDEIVDKKRKNRKEYRKFITRVKVIPEDVREKIIKDGYISNKDLRKLVTKSPMEMLHDNIELQIQAEVNKYFNECKGKIAELEKQREENMPALQKVEAQKAKEKERLELSIEEINKAMLRNAKDNGIELDSREIKKSNELFREVGKKNAETKSTLSNTKSTPQVNKPKQTNAKQSNKTVVENNKNTPKKDKKNIFTVIKLKIEELKNKKYEKMARKQSIIEEEAKKARAAKLQGIAKVTSSIDNELRSLGSMVTSQEELAINDLKNANNVATKRVNKEMPKR